MQTLDPVQAGVDFDDAVLGLGLPAAAEKALGEAALLRSEPAMAMAARSVTACF